MVPSTGRVDRPSVTLSSARVRAPSSTSLTGSATPAPNSCCQRRTGSSPNPVTDSTVAVGDKRTTLDPVTAGLSFDATATGSGSVAAALSESSRRLTASGPCRPPISTPATVVPGGTRSAHSHRTPTYRPCLLYTSPSPRDG